jgi:leader peptidase (prepilin peptidase)/N-methyltransferase
MNFPILSFLWTSGQCQECGYAYSIRYPIVEFLNAVLFFVVWTIYGWHPQLIIFWGLSSTLLAMSFIDLEFRIIPDELSLGGWAVAIVIALLGVFQFPLSASESIFGSLFGYFSFWILSKLYAFFTAEEGLGGGDVKLMGLIGAVLGFRGVLTTILLGSLLGSLIGILFIIIFKKSKKFPIPFGPFLAVGAYAAIFRLDELWWP